MEIIWSIAVLFGDERKESLGKEPSKEQESANRSKEKISEEEFIREEPSAVEILCVGIGRDVICSGSPSFKLSVSRS